MVMVKVEIVYRAFELPGAIRDKILGGHPGAWYYADGQLAMPGSRGPDGPPGYVDEDTAVRMILDADIAERCTVKKMGWALDTTNYMLAYPDQPGGRASRYIRLAPPEYGKLLAWLMAGTRKTHSTPPEAWDSLVRELGLEDRAELGLLIRDLAEVLRRDTGYEVLHVAPHGEFYFNPVLDEDAGDRLKTGKENAPSW